MTHTQKGVVKGIVIGLLLTLILFALAIMYHPLLMGMTLTGFHRGDIVFRCALLLALPLAICIIRLARYRFFHQEAIDAAISQEHSRRAQVLQAILQNTLEQTVLAFLVYVAWLGLAPASFMPVLIVALGLFLMGRLCFVIGYQSGAAARSFGFALTFYPTLLMMVLLLVFIIY